MMIELKIQSLIFSSIIPCPSILLKFPNSLHLNWLYSLSVQVLFCYVISDRQPDEWKDLRFLTLKWISKRRFRDSIV
jgi:hypothetical protein